MSKKNIILTNQADHSMRIHQAILLLLLFSFFSSYSNTNIKTEIFYFTDFERQLTNTDILTKTEAFRAIDIDELNFSPNKGNIWLLIKSKNNTDVKQDLIFEIENLLINPIFYSFSSSENNQGTKLKNTLDGHSHSVALSLDSNEETQILIKVESHNFPTAIPLEVKTQTNFIKHSTKHSILIGVIIGFLLVIILMSLTLWIVGRSRMAAYLFGFLITTTLYFIIMDGLTMFYTGYGNIELTIMIAKSLLPFSVGFLGLYFNELFEIKIVNKLKYKQFNAVGVVLITLSSLFIMFNSYSSTMYQLSYFIIALGILYNMAIPYNAFKNKQSQPYLIIIGLLSFSLFLILKIAFDLGIVPINKVSIQYPKIGYLILIICLGLSIARRFRQRSNNLKTLNNHLDILVKERTVEINNQNEELKTQTEELEAQREELETQKEELEAQKEELITQKERLVTQNIELERLELVASKTDNVIYIFSPEGELIWFNSSFSSYLGMTFNEFVANGKVIKIDEISGNFQIREHLQRCLLAKTKEVYESKLTIDSKVCWYQTTLTPIFEENEIKYVVAIDSDITRLKQYESEIDQQRSLAVKRKNELELQQTEMTDSLRYAQRIQTAILPQGKDIKRFFPESFVLFKPRDIVSGDFYWFHRIGNKFVFIAVDCTGHGVPGAFMSIIGTYLLNNIIIQNNETRPAEILKQLNRKLKISLKNENPQFQTNDGMDVSLVTIDTETNKLQYAGALRPLFLCTQGDFLEIKGDKIPITSEIVGNVMAQYKEWEFDVSKGDRFYMFSDGIIDQFGGADNKKFLTKRFKQLILDAQSFSMTEQNRLIEQAITDWRGKNVQIDDILVIGIQI